MTLWKSGKGMSSLGLITLYLPTVMELTFNSSAMHFVWLDCSSNRIDSVVHDNNPYVITRISSFFWVSIWIIANNTCVFCCLFVFFFFFFFLRLLGIWYYVYVKFGQFLRERELKMSNREGEVRRGCIGFVTRGKMLLEGTRKVI